MRIRILRAHGLNKTDISRPVKKCPRLLLYDAEKNLLPKLEFLASVCLSGKGLGRVLCCNPELMRLSLEKCTIPYYDIIKGLHLLNDNNLVRFFRILRWVGLAKMRSNIAPNISVLSALGVPETSMSYWVSHRPFLVSLEFDKFKDNVKEVMSMGVPPWSASFMKVMYVITRVNEPEWAQKMELYRKWGWTEDDFLLAFRKNPQIMELAEKNFSSKMDFLVNKVGWQLADVVGSPIVLVFSLRNWIIPRCSVIRILMSKGLIVNGEFSMATLLGTGKDNFLDRFVVKYQ